MRALPEKHVEPIVRSNPELPTPFPVRNEMLKKGNYIFNRKESTELMTGIKG
jgi:hypothetical protein